MPIFATPEPISVDLDLAIGDVRITASERDDTVVEVRPGDGEHEPDVRAAAQTLVEFAAGRLVIKAPKPRALGLFGKPGAIDVTIELPEGSTLRSAASIGMVRGAGRLGECRVRTTGDIELDRTGPLDLHAGAGAVVVDRAVGHVEVSTGSGRVRVRAIDGSAVIKNSNGDNWIGEVTGDLRVTTANGDISVEHASADVTASTANGDVRLGTVIRGSASLKTACGEVEVGIRAGTAARLDVFTQFGKVRNDLDPISDPGTDAGIDAGIDSVDIPEQPGDTVDVRARTAYGDIVVRRA
ncbi:MAG TPA: DUF4097 family beta strand repeat-containing protein [Amycolatopsis sp.]|jgi:hypothetical protein|nr:DUF4097 family beta strand repeat-containing protein [Amycolatopsis sp.]